MPGINGIFEPFKKYVRDQLGERREILKNRTTGKFYPYTTNKTCYLRMVSGVNIKKKNDILESGESGYTEEKLAKQYILEGGTLYYNRIEKSITEQPMRESFTEGKEESRTRGFTYGDDHVRADAKDGFGIVPMPGITDAEIRTKTPEGSLREAIVNFECHNRRQLHVLEALYMRPGYPVLLEWGWTPYIHSEDGLETSGASIARKFLDPEKIKDTTGNLFNKLNLEIIEKKSDSEGNYDGFIGIIKNFNFSSKDDGGYNCTCEIIAQGEILESLRSKKQFLKTEQWEIVDGPDEEATKKGYWYGAPYASNTSGNVGRKVVAKKTERSEILDSFLLYLKSIKAVFDKSGDEAFLQVQGTEGEKRKKVVNVKKTLPPTGTVYDIIVGPTTAENPEYINVDALEYKDLNKVSPKYQEAFQEVHDLIEDIRKINYNNMESSYGFSKNNKYNEQKSGLTPFYGGLIVQQITRYVSGQPDRNSGYRKNIFVRWDLICQIFNHKAVNSVGITDTSDEPIAEMTYLAPNQQTYDFSSDEKIDNSSKGEGKNKNQFKEYIRYMGPKPRPTIPGELKSADPYGHKMATKYTKTQNSYLVGTSLNEGVCLMPHQQITADLYQNDQFAPDRQELEFDQPDIFDNGYEPVYPTPPPISTQFTSYKNCVFNEYSIGGVLFNIDYLIRAYEGIATVKNEATQTQRAKPTINFNKYFNMIWDGVNEACGYYYDFGLHIEHERPHVGRIIDFHFGGELRKSTVFEFKPQLDGSVVRNFNFTSEIPADMSSVISVAAQAPNDVNDLESLSFKAFHKGIESRFSAPALTEEEIEESKKAAREVLEEDVTNYIAVLRSLREYSIMFNNMYFNKIDTGDKDEEGNIVYRLPISAEKAIDYIQDLEEERISIESRYPLYKEGGKENHPLAGLPRPNTTYHRSAIIPLKFDVQMDGIGGITPLTLFKVNKNTLPIGYQADNILFIVKEEKQKITSGQDWVTEFNGQLVLQDTNPNYEGVNLSLSDENLYFQNLDKEINQILAGYQDTKSYGKAVNPQTIKDKTFEVAPVEEEFTNLGLIENDVDLELDYLRADANTPGAIYAEDENGEKGWRMYGEYANHYNDWSFGGHQGQDVHAPPGTPAVYPITGVITLHGDGGEVAGLRTVICRKDGICVFMGHMQELNNNVKKGDTVTAGTSAGKVGFTGSARDTNPHIHLNTFVQKLGYFEGTLNPVPFLQSVYKKFDGRHGTNALKLRNNNPAPHRDVKDYCFEGNGLCIDACTSTGATNGCSA